MEKYYRVNLKRWNELVRLHADSEEYDLKGFIVGKNSLHGVELAGLGDVSGKSLLHLQCHFGLDALSWARLGAKVTGVDFSDTAIKLAEEIAGRIGVEAEFICCNVYELADHLDGEYDIVYTSYGALCWLHDINAWARIVSRYLKPGGTFFLAEFHPFTWVFDEKSPSELRVKYGYWQGEEPEYDEEDGSYAAPNAKLENRGSYNWAHPLSEVITALIDSGLTVREFHEYPFSVDAHQLALMERTRDGYSRLKSGNIPLMYSLKAIKDQR